MNEMFMKMVDELEDVSFDGTGDSDVVDQAYIPKSAPEESRFEWTVPEMDHIFAQTNTSGMRANSNTEPR